MLEGYRESRKMADPPSAMGERCCGCHFSPLRRKPALAVATPGTTGTCTLVRDAIGPVQPDLHADQNVGAPGRRGATQLSTTWRAIKIIPIGPETSWP